MAFCLYAIGLVLLGVWLALRHRNGYWHRRGVPFVRAAPLLGNHPAGGKSAAIGIHIFHKPALMVRDLDLVKAILVRDFASFNNRQSASDVKNDMMGGASLFFIKNPAWKTLRVRLSPTFTSGKMKQMFELMREVGAEFNAYMLSMRLDEKTKMFRQDFRDLFSRLLVDNIASCAFGIRTNSFRDPDNEFSKSTRKIFRFTPYRALEFASVFFLPEIVPWFKFKVFGKDSDHFLRESCYMMMDQRAKSGTKRNDLIDTLLNLREEDKDKPFSYTNITFQGDVLVAQAANFFTAAYETTSNAMSFCLFELCRRSEMQDRIRAEIKKSLEASNGELTYDSVLDMQYLGMVLAEVLRMYPPVPFLDRECTIPSDSQGYDLRHFSINYKIPRGMPIIVPLQAIQRDPKYWPDPDRFDPERFSAENKVHIVPYSYLPFGEGPHSCIGSRFAQLQSRLGLVNFFLNHRVAPSELTPTQAVFDRYAILTHMEGGVHLNVIRDPL